MPLSIAGLKKIITKHMKLDLAIRGGIEYDLTMTMLAITILVHFWVVYCATGPAVCTLWSNKATWRILGQ